MMFLVSVIFEVLVVIPLGRFLKCKRSYISEETAICFLSRDTDLQQAEQQSGGETPVHTAAS